MCCRRQYLIINSILLCQTTLVTPLFFLFIKTLWQDESSRSSVLSVAPLRDIQAALCVTTLEPILCILRNRILTLVIFRAHTNMHFPRLGVTFYGMVRPFCHSPAVWTTRRLDHTWAVTITVYFSLTKHKKVQTKLNNRGLWTKSKWCPDQTCPNKEWKLAGEKAPFTNRIWTIGGFF